MQLVFVSEPGDKEKWLLSEKCSVFDHSDACALAFDLLQAQRKSKGKPPVEFRYNKHELVRA